MARWLSIPTVLLALFASGCGGSSSHSTSTSGGGSGSTNENAALIAQADPICQQVNARISAINAVLGHATNLSSAHTLRKVAQTGIGLATYEHQAIARLSALQAPPSLSQDWQTLLAGMQQLANYTAQLAVEAKAKNANLGEETIARSRELQKQLIAVATRDGFQHCGRLN